MRRGLLGTHGKLPSMLGWVEVVNVLVGWGLYACLVRMTFLSSYDADDSAIKTAWYRTQRQMMI